MILSICYSANGWKKNYQYVCQTFGRKLNQLWLRVSKQTEDPICGQKLITAFNRRSSAIIHARMTKLYLNIKCTYRESFEICHLRWTEANEHEINNKQTRSKLKLKKTVNRFAESALHFSQIEIETRLEKNGTFASRRRTFVCFFGKTFLFCTNWNMFVLFIYLFDSSWIRRWKMRHTHTSTDVEAVFVFWAERIARPFIFTVWHFDIDISARKHR